MENLKKVASLIGEALNVGSALLHKKGIGVVFNLSDEAMAVASMAPDALKAELPLLLVKVSRDEVLNQLKGKLALENKVVEGKIKEALDVASDALEVVAKVKKLVS